MKHILDFIKGLPTKLEEGKVVALLIDGLGTLGLNLPGFSVETYETVFPSSTPTFMYTFHSMIPPAQHGFLEWYMRFKGTIVAVPPWVDVLRDRELRLGKDVSEEDIFPFKPLPEVLADKGFSVTYYTPFADSAFTKAVTRGAEVREIKYLSQVFPLSDADATFIYWPSIDSILHERYVDEALRAEVEFMELFVKQLVRKIPRKTTLYVLADHGLTLCRRRHVLPVIGSEPPVGGERVAFYRGVGVDEVKEGLSAKGISAEVLKMEEVPHFKGELSPRCISNYGDVVVIAEEHECFKYPFEGGREKGLGAHGGLSREEIFINVWGYRKE